MWIEKLKIFTSDPEKQLQFYRDVLELDISNFTEDSFEVKTGFSTLIFQKNKNSTPYHIAFHIPALQEKQALEWLKPKMEILKDWKDEIIDFSSWKAKSIYFYDADKNVLEFISRKALFPSKNGIFSAKNILGISEIGSATNNVLQKFDFLNKHFSLKKFTGNYETFCATGDDEGLFIVVDKNRKT